MEKKFTKAMVCSEFKSKCRECPLFCTNNFKFLPCSVLTDDDINTIMKDYPYADVKVRTIFNDIETRLAAVEEKVEKKDEPKFTMFEVIDKKLYDKLEAKHEADCRLISEYDLEIKKLDKQNIEQNDTICDLYSNLCTEQKERIRCEAVIEDKNKEIDKYRRHIAELKSRHFDLKNAENESEHYKGLYSSKCDDYDKLLENKIKNEKSSMEEVAKYKNLFHSLNHKHQKVVGEMKSWKERAMEAENKLEKLKKPEKLRTALETENSALRATLESVSKDYDKLKSECYIAQENLKITKEKYDDACKMNKMREDVFESNLNLKKTIEAKDREINLLRAELDKFMSNKDNDYDDRWLD